MNERELPPGWREIPADSDIGGEPVADCILEPIDDKFGYCRACDPARRRPILLEAKRNCRQPSSLPQQQPTLRRALANYLAALRRWIKAGRPVRPQEEVDHILEHVCKPCERYDSKRKTCSTCGCRVNDGPALANKLAMATESCPLGKWPPAGVMSANPPK